MPKTIFLIHGRSFKPPEEKLRRLWFGAIESGFARDYSSAKKHAFEMRDRQFIYYGDISNRFLKTAMKAPYNFDTDDSRNRKQTLRRLKMLKSDQFTKAQYERLPGKSAIGEALADLLGGVTSFFQISEPIIKAIAPDLCEYWNFDSQFGSAVRARLSEPLAQAMRDGRKILLIAHSLGTMIAYDTLWKFSHDSKFRDIRERKIDLFITLGSPLADETVKRNLKGAGLEGAEKYPSNIRRWVNFAAEDDYISHDGKVKNDYREMLDLGLIDSIKDERIYNLAVREDKSNPHHSGGYLIHPKVVKLVANWLE